MRTCFTILACMVLAVVGCSRQKDATPNTTQSDTELRSAIVGTWRSVDAAVEGLSTFSADGKVKYAGTIKNPMGSGEPIPYTATGSYEIENGNMTIVIETSSGSIVGIWDPGMVMPLRLVEITETEWTYEIMGGPMAGGPHTEERVK